MSWATTDNIEEATHDSGGRSRPNWKSAIVLAVVAWAIALGPLGGLLLILFNPSQSFDLNPTIGNQAQIVELSLSGTDDPILIRFDPKSNVEPVSTSILDAASFDGYRVTDCRNGCTVQFVLTEGFAGGSVKIEYVEDYFRSSQVEVDSFIAP